MPRARLTPWIVLAAAACAAAGAWCGHQIGDGGGGNIALISATCGIIGSFLPGAAAWLRARLRGQHPPRQGAA